MRMNSDPVKIKTIVTVMLLLFGSGVTLVLVNSVQSVYAYQSTGIAIDYGDRNVEWTDVDFNIESEPVLILENICNFKGYTLVIEENTVTEINGISNDDDRSWDLWVIENGELDWIKLTDAEIDASEYTVTVWAYCSDEEVPTVGVDQFGRCIYGYPQAQKTVTLSPSITEILGALNATSTIVGTDKYSNYPNSVANGKADGSIVEVGDFLSPSFELIMKSNPDLVLCDGSQYAHYELAERIRSTTTVNAVVLYSGESIDTIIDNIYIVGLVMGYDIRAEDVINQLEYAEMEILHMVGENETYSKSTVFALSPNKAPWVAGSSTYVDDIIVTLLSENVYSSSYGWVQSNSELIAKSNPEIATIISDEYSATESDYNTMLDNLSAEWKQTDAYKNNQIYLLSGELAEMAQTPGPRYAQLMEIIALILYHEIIYPDETFPNYIGDNYRDFLTITEYLGFE